jgi:hypothetical protein
MSPSCVWEIWGLPESFEAGAEAFVLDVAVGFVDCGARVELESEVGIVVHLWFMIYFIVTLLHGAVESATTVGVGRTFTITSHQGASEISGAGEGVNANGSTEGPVGRTELYVTVESAVTNGTTAVFVVICAILVGTGSGGIIDDSSSVEKSLGGSFGSGVTAGKRFMSKLDNMRGAEKGIGTKGDGRGSALKGIVANFGTPGLSSLMTAGLDVLLPEVSVSSLCRCC